MCHSDCICQGWKDANCGGNFSGDPKKCTLSGKSTSVLDMVAVEASGRLTRTERSPQAMMQTRRGVSSEDAGLDSALEDKCVG